MATFTLDTSGAVGPMPSGYDDPENRRGFWSFPRARYAWSDLSPFVQGYVEALFAASDAAMPGDRLTAYAGFSDLDPSALALILRDCARFQRLKTVKTPPLSGAAFWTGRQAGTWPTEFPPLQPYLSDEGRVCLREAA